MSEHVDPAAGPETPDQSEQPEQPRRHPSTIGGMWYLVVLAVTAAGIGIVWGRDWRIGTYWVAGALLAAATARLLLPQRDAGMLAVRHRMLDVALLAGVGVALVFLALTIPNQPG